MIRPVLGLLLLLIAIPVIAQEKLDKLTVEKIMRDPRWIGTSPSNLQWTQDGYLYFNWNPDKAPADSLYYITVTNRAPVKATTQQVQDFTTTGNPRFNQARTAYTFAKDGDVFYTDVKTNKTRRITQTIDLESNPVFSFNE